MRKITFLIFIFLGTAYTLKAASLKDCRQLYKKSQEYLEETKHSLKEILRTQPYNKEAKILWAKVLYREGKFQDAFEIFSSLEDMLDGESLFFYGNILERKNLYQQAQDVYRRIKEGPYARLAQKALSGIKKKLSSSKIEPYLQELMESQPQPQAWECGAEIFLVDEEVEITPDNQEITKVHFLARILNDRGKKIGEVKIPYDSTYERIIHLEARTITPEGKVFEVGKENIRDVSKYLDYPLYSNLRVRIISMPQVDKNSIIEYRAVIKRTHLVDRDKFSLVYFLQDKYPIRKEVFSLKVPKGKKINIYLRNTSYLGKDMDLSPSVSRSGSDINYRWVFKNVPALIEEPSMVPSSWVNPSFIATNFSSWEQIHKWWYNLYKDKIVATPLIKKTVKEIIGQSKDPCEILEKIFQFCAQKIRYVAVEYGRAGYEPHKAEDILTNKYGDCKDQSILLVSLLRAAGIEAYPVLIPTRELLPLRKDEPCIVFNHCIVYARLNKGEFFLDPTMETANIHTLPFPDQDRLCAVFFDDKCELLKTPLAEGNVLEVEMNIKPQGKLFKVRRKIICRGLFSPHQRYFVNYTHPQILKNTLLKKAKTFLPDASLLGFKIENRDDPVLPLVITYDFQGEDSFKNYADLYVQRRLAQAELSEELISQSQRRYPLNLGFPYVLKARTQLEIPQGFKTYYLPQKERLVSPWIEYERSCQKRRSSILFEEKMKIKKTQVDLEDYQKFKKFYEELLSQVHTSIVFLKKNEEKRQEERFKN